MSENRSPGIVALCEGLAGMFLMAFVPVGVRYVGANVFTIGFVRLAVAVICLFVVLSPSLRRTRLSLRDLRALFLIGFCFWAHWATYFYSIKLSSASIGCISLSTYGIHLVILGWFFQGHRATAKDLIAIVLATLGNLLLVPEFSLQNNVTLGICFGVLSGLIHAILPILHQRNQQMSSQLRALGQFGFALLMFAVFLPKANWDFPADHWKYLLLLGFVSTFMAHTLWVRAVTVLSMVSTSIISYFYLPAAVMLSVLILGEELTPSMLAGAALIIGGNLVALLGQWRQMSFAAQVHES